MVEYVKLSPITRLEGHLGITARIDSDNVNTAYSHGEMFRGIEKILIGRDPRDAPIITSRTCGVCHFIHRHTSLRAIENAAGWSFPAPQALDAGAPGTGQTVPGSGSGIARWLDGNRSMQNPGVGGGNPLPAGAQLARNIVHGLTYVYSHAAHTIALAAPDYKARIDAYVEANGSSLPGYVDGSESSTVGAGGSSFFDNFLQEAVVAQRILHEMLGFLGGKVPHQQSAIPGGFSRSFSGQLTLSPLAGGGTDMDAVAILASKTIALGGADPSVGSPPQWPLLDLTGGLDAQKGLTANAAGGVANDWIANRVVPFTLALAVGAVQENAHTWGQGSGNFVCAPTFDIVTVAGVGGATSTAVTGEAYFRGGAYISDSLAANNAGTYYLDNSVADSVNSNWVTIYEDITSGKYPEPDDITGRPVCGGYPGDAETHPLVGEAEDRYTYTWYKATRVKDVNDKLFTVESGPHARLVVNGVDPDLNLDGVTVPGVGTAPDPIPQGTGVRQWVLDQVGSPIGAFGSSTWNRLISRLQDALLVIDMMIGSDYSGENQSGYWLNEIFTNKCWLARLDGAISAYGGTVSADAMVQDTPPYGAWENLNGVAGAGYWDAPRGITCHFCKVDDGLLTQYQHIAGTTWNGNGRDAQGNPGPFEWSLMGMTKVETDVPFTQNPGGNWTASVTGPVCERTVFIKYDIQYAASGSTKTYTAIDKPKLDGSGKGQIVGQGLKDTSEIDYVNGTISLDFKYNYDLGYTYMSNVVVDQYGYAANPVPAPATWDGYMGYGYSADSTKPNPINLLRTIRSYDPCLACSIQVVDKEGREGKYEAVPVAGWDPK